MILTGEQKQFVTECRKLFSWRMMAKLFAEKYGIIEPVKAGTDHYSQLDGMMLCDLAEVAEEESIMQADG